MEVFELLMVDLIGGEFGEVDLGDENMEGENVDEGGMINDE